MKLVIEMELDNDAFTEKGGDEIRRVLNELCDRMPQTPIDWCLSRTPKVKPKHVMSLHDVNGNNVGTARFK